HGLVRPLDLGDRFALIDRLHLVLRHRVHGRKAKAEDGHACDEALTNAAAHGVILPKQAHDAPPAAAAGAWPDFASTASVMLAGRGFGRSIRPRTGMMTRKRRK